MKNFVFIEGFDGYNGMGANTGLLGRWSNVGSAAATLQAGRYGGQCLRCTDGAGSQSAYRAGLGAPVSAFAIGAAYKQTGLDNIGTQPLFYLLDASAAVMLGVYCLGATQQLQVRIGTATVAIATPVGKITADAWYYLEVIGTFADSGGTLAFYINGELIGTFVGDTKVNASAVASLIQFNGADGSGSSNYTWWDDIYCTSSAERVGERKIESLRPVADTANKSFVPSTGVNNFACVDDATVDTTDYVSGSAVGDFDRYELSDLSSIPEAIDAVQVVMFGLKTDAATRAFKLSIERGGSIVKGAEQFLGASSLPYRQIFNADPQTGVDFNPATFNSITAGVEVTV